jgi:hypothetical protein
MFTRRGADAALARERGYMRYWMPVQSGELLLLIKTFMLMMTSGE